MTVGIGIASWKSPDNAAALPRITEWNARSTAYKSLSAGTPTAGGYLIADQAFDELIAAQQPMNIFRSIARTLPPIAPGASRVVPSADELMADAAWTTELDFGAEDSQVAFGSRLLTPHAIAKHVRASKDVGRIPNAEAHIRDMLARSVAIPQERAFIDGDGVGEPLGLLKTIGLPTYASTTAGQIYGDDVLAWFYSLPSKYRRRAVIVTSSAFARKRRMLSKPSTGVAFDGYIDIPKFETATADGPARLEGAPVYESDEFPSPVDGSDNWVSGATVAVIFDPAYFWIQDSTDLRIEKLVELRAEHNQDVWIVRQESDAMCILPESACALAVK